MPLDSPPPSLWTDASGFSVDASGLVPPHPPPQVRPGGGMGGTDCRVSVSGFLMPLDWSPPTLWTDASGFSVDASGLVPPHQVRMGGGRGGQPLNYYKMYNIVCSMLNNHGIT